MQDSRLRVTLKQRDSRGLRTMGRNTIVKTKMQQPNELLRQAQREIVEQEIFSELLKEASNLPSSTARVSERFITVEVAEDIELQFEKVRLSYQSMKPLCLV